MSIATTQQEFLRAALSELGMARDACIVRLGAARRTLDKRLLPADSKDSRNMDETSWNLAPDHANYLCRAS